MTTRTDPHAQLVAFWCDTYAAHVGAKYPFVGGKDGATIKWLRSLYSDDEIKALITAFFAMDDPFIEDAGHGLGVFRGCLPKVIKVVAKRRKPDVNGHVPPCATRTECDRRLFEELRAKRSQAS